MIRLVTGALRGGKTSYCVGLAINDYLAKGLTVFTNVELHPDEIAGYIRRKHRLVMRPEQIVMMNLVEERDWTKIIQWGSRGAPVLVLLDEVHLHFNSRNWAKTQKELPDMLGFLSQSGKAAVDIIFIAQVASTLEKQFRDQCELEYYCRALKTIKIPILGLLPFNKMLLVERDKATDKALSRSLVKYDKEIWACYNSFAFLDENMQSQDLLKERLQPYKLERVPRISRNGWLALAVAFLGLCVYLYLTK